MSDSLVSLFSNQLTIFPQEKIHLHTDKSYYITGEKIWFRAHLVDAATHIPCPVSRYVYVEMFNLLDSLITRVKIRNNNDTYHGHIEIPQDIPEGDYILRAYTHFMRNLAEHYFCIKTIRIGNPDNRMAHIDTPDTDGKTNVAFSDNDFDVSFYPEGGYMLQGVNCRVAFKAQMSDGRAANIEGVVYDHLGNETGQMKTDYHGMGSFTIYPQEDVSYHVICTNDRQQTKRFELPAARQTGYALSANTLNKDYIYMSVLKCVPDERRELLYLMAHTRGIVHYAAQWNEAGNVIRLPKKQLPSGVLHLVLFDAELNPMSERLVFVNNDDCAQVTYRNDRERYAARMLVDNHVLLTGDEGSPLSGSFSVAVTDDNAVAIDTTSSILTQLLLTSDLRGNIENPAAYFSNDMSSVLALDLLMLTQGWRRYDMAALARGRPVYPAIPLEFGAEITGRVRRALADKPLDKVKLTIASSNSAYFDFAETDSAGRFSFRGSDQPDSVLFIIQAVRSSWNSNPELLIDEDTFPERTLPIVTASAEFSKKSLEQYMEKATLNYQQEKDIWKIELSEVTVTARKPIPKSVFRPTYVLSKEQIKHAPKRNGMLSVLTATIPGVYLDKDGNLKYQGADFRTLIIDDRINKRIFRYRTL